jgi:hypothetical protein
MAETLAEKKCTPCRGGTPPLTLEEAERFQSQTPNWELRDDGMRPFRCAPRKSRDCTRTILSWRARSIGRSIGRMALPIVSEVRTLEPWQPRAIVLSRFSAEPAFSVAVIVRHLRLNGFCVRVASRHLDRGHAQLLPDDPQLRSIKGATRC